jgi:hypothetical protein
VINVCKTVQIFVRHAGNKGSDEFLKRYKSLGVLILVNISKNYTV